MFVIEKTWFYKYVFANKKIKRFTGFLFYVKLFYEYCTSIITSRIFKFESKACMCWMCLSLHVRGHHRWAPLAVFMAVDNFARNQLQTYMDQVCWKNGFIQAMHSNERDCEIRRSNGKPTYTRAYFDHNSISIYCFIWASILIPYQQANIRVDEAMRFEKIERMFEWIPERTESERKFAQRVIG